MLPGLDARGRIALPVRLGQETLRLPRALDVPGALPTRRTPDWRSPAEGPSNALGKVSVQETYPAEPEVVRTETQVNEPLGLLASSEALLWADQWSLADFKGVIHLDA